MTAYYQSPIGLLKINVTQEKITSIVYTKEINPQKKQRKTSKTDPVVEKTITQLKEYFEGKRKKFDLPLLIHSTTFEEKVYLQLIKIPYGEKNTYGAIAQKCDSPKASRAVGNACKKNKFLIVIPCHRVVGSNQKLVGFSAGGVKNKAWLLNFEKENLNPNN